MYSMLLPLGLCINYDAGCTTGFVDFEILRSLATPIHPLTFKDGYQTIFPGINFTCAGSITAWTLIALHNPGTNSTHPELQVWRRFTGEDTLFEKVASTRLSGLGENGTFLYTYDMDPPLQFQEGDVLGVFEPHESRNLLRIDYQLLGNTPEFFVEFIGENDIQPLPTVNTAIDTDNYSSWNGYQPLIAVTTGI